MACFPFFYFAVLKGSAPSHLCVVKVVAAVHLFAVGGVVHMPLLARRRKPPLRRQACARPLGSLRACGARGMLGMGAMYGVLPIQAHLDGGRVLIRPRSSFVYGWGDAFMRLLGIHIVTMCLDNAFYLYAFPQCPTVLMVAGFGCRAFPAPAFHRMGRARRVHPFVTRAPRRSAN